MSYIYVAESGEGYCKVGKSNNPKQRIKQMSHEFGISFTRFMQFKCSDDPMHCESMCHKSLERNNVFGEFFKVSFDIACSVASEMCKEIAPKKKPQKIIDSALREAKLAGFEGGVREVAKWLGVTDKTIRHRFNHDRELFEASLRNAKEIKNKSN